MQRCYHLKRSFIPPPFFSFSFSSLLFIAHTLVLCTRSNSTPSENGVSGFSAAQLLSRGSFYGGKAGVQIVCPFFRREEQKRKRDSFKSVKPGEFLLSPLPCEQPFSSLPFTPVLRFAQKKKEATTTNCCPRIINAYTQPYESTHSFSTPTPSLIVLQGRDSQTLLVVLFHWLSLRRARHTHTHTHTHTPPALRRPRPTRDTAKCAHKNYLSLSWRFFFLHFLSAMS